MQVIKPAGPDPTGIPARGVAGPSPQSGLAAGLAARPAAALADQLSIHPLDVPAALQILVAEVRAEFALLLEAAANSRPPPGFAPGFDPRPGPGPGPDPSPGPGGAPGTLPGTLAGTLAGTLPGAAAGSLGGALPGTGAEGSMPGGLAGSLAGALPGGIEGSLPGGLAASLTGTLPGGGSEGSLPAGLAASLTRTLPGDLAAILVGNLPGLLAGALPSGVLASPIPTAHALIEMFLKAASDDGDPSLSAATTAHVENGLQSAMDRALRVVEGWRDVTRPVIDAAADTRELVVRLVFDDPPSPLWLRPEWLGLAPFMETIWRRRRRMRLGLSDPDLDPQADPGAVTAIDLPADAEHGSPSPEQREPRGGGGDDI